MMSLFSTCNEPSASSDATGSASTGVAPRDINIAVYPLADRPGWEHTLDTDLPRLRKALERDSKITGRCFTKYGDGRSSTWYQTLKDVVREKSAVSQATKSTGIVYGHGNCIADIDHRLINDNDRFSKDHTGDVLKAFKRDDSAHETDIWLSACFSGAAQRYRSYLSPGSRLGTTYGPSSCGWQRGIEHSMRYITDLINHSHDHHSPAEAVKIIDEGLTLERMMADYARHSPDAWPDNQLSIGTSEGAVLTCPKLQAAVNQDARGRLLVRTPLTPEFRRWLRGTGTEFFTSSDDMERAIRDVDTAGEALRDGTDSAEEPSQRNVDRMAHLYSAYYNPVPRSQRARWYEDPQSYQAEL